MILTRIEAENILKYRRLRLTGLPARGHIAVSGPNEAGKTAVGETICFALFGRTFSLGPDEIDKVIRWGEYGGSVTVEFVGTDGSTYRIVRSIDNTGKHDARLYLGESTGDAEPLAEGPDAVADAVREFGGFTFKSFIDSFYLAQRELEMPHGKSETIKALIGIDRLEAVAKELQSEVAETTKLIGSLETRIHADNQKIARINLDRAHLGRLDAQRDAKTEAAAKAEADRTDLSARADTVGKAAAAFAKSAEMFVRSTLRTNFGQWRDRKECVASGLVAATKACKASGLDDESRALETTNTAIKSFEAGLVEYDQVRNLATLYRRRLTDLLDGHSVPDASNREVPPPNTESDIPFAHRRAAVSARINDGITRRRRQLGLGVFFVELALLAWAGWVVLVAAPESTIGGWLQAVIALGTLGRQFVLLFTAIVSTGLTGLFTTLYVRTTHDLRECDRQLETIEKETQIARAEIDVIDAMEKAAMPDALDALRTVRNGLLNSAVVLFAEGDGAVLVQPDAHAAKLGEIRRGSTEAARSLKRAQQRIMDRAADRQREAMELQAAVGQLDQQIAEERQRWEQVQQIEQSVGALTAKANELRHQIAVRHEACQLIDGACRRIYARFHPELRRFVSRLLPRLTEDRYEHLELDEDLRVRVFCKEKNDFVGLAEISNGTHRQLMLCVRLALSQALIASSSKAAQFLFFDEPFAFFDERRMAKAIEVLRKISPQITQVWLAAQRFDHDALFDVVLDCNVNNDCIEVSGNGLPRPAFERRG